MRPCARPSTCILLLPRPGNLCITSCGSSSRTIQSQPYPLFTSEDKSHALFNYTSGRWLYNEQSRLADRRLVFDIQALTRAVAKAVGTSVDTITNIRKLAEGGSYRVFEVTITDSHPLIVRVPYPCTLPRAFGTASEVATLQYLRAKGFPVPTVLDWQTSSDNNVGSEYIIMSKVAGKGLEETWDDLQIEERLDMVERVVKLETRLFGLDFPAYGSIYHSAFMDQHPSIQHVDLEGGFCIGPSTEYLWWYQGRDRLCVNRGPWQTTEEFLLSVGQRELAWLKEHGAPQFPEQPLYGDFYNKQPVRPEPQMRTLESYLQAAPLIVPSDQSMTRAVIRRPDLSPNNILVSSKGDISGLIDWQHATVKPFFIHAKIPEHFQNHGDEDSEENKKPTLPETFESMDENDKEKELEKYRRRQLHYFYTGFTARMHVPHFEAMTDYDYIARNKLYEAAGRPWEGDNTSLKAELIRACKWWPQISNERCPVEFPEDEVETCLSLDRRQVEADNQLQVLRDFFPVSIEG